MKQYLWIKGSEDGVRITPMTKDELNKELQNQEDIKEEYKAIFMSDYPENMDTNYWGNKVIILEIKGSIIPTVKLSV